ncbi:hypothetical protein BSAF29S_06344 [Bacillus safensis subsp. safensis]
MGCMSSSELEQVSEINDDLKKLSEQVSNSYLLIRGFNLPNAKHAGSIRIRSGSS